MRVRKKYSELAKWYVGALTDGAGRQTSVPLSFLDPGKRYTATIWRDGASADGQGKDRHAMEVETRSVAAADILDLRIAPAGGFAIEFVPQD